MKHNFLFIILAVLIGGIAPIQGGINSQLGKLLNHPMQATFISFLGGVLTILILLLIININFPAAAEMKKIPWYLYIGGVFGVVFVTVVIVLMPKIGATNLVVAIIVGQLVMSVIVDHFGLLKVPVHEISWTRLVGIVLLILGVFLVQKT